ncbi:HIT family protein [Streptomyces virginiae]|uniref:HIT family protein n=1 Tax=Streptomyces TaxID=1883 RepID=UPI003426D513
MPPEIECVGSDLCEELAGVRDTAFSVIYNGDPISRLICETRSFRLMVDLSPLISGHLLLLPVEHYFSFGQAVEDLDLELSQLMRRIEPMYRDEFGQFVILEHGSVLGMRASACISHAHWHILPLDGSLVNEMIVRDGLEPAVLTDQKQLSEFNNIPYYMCLSGGEFHVYQPSSPLRSQYLRSIVGNIIGIDDPLWDYALVTRTELLRETVRRTASWRLDVSGGTERGCRRTGSCAQVK